jgi:hypothetical protein
MGTNLQQKKKNKVNKNTRAARALGLSNQNTTTLGTGERREIVARNAVPVYKGSACNTGRIGKKKWVGAMRAPIGGSAE